MKFSALDRDQPDSPMAEINITPLVDVMLVLLVVFLVTAPMLTHSVKMELPKEIVGPANSVAEAVIISIDTNGQYYWNNQNLTFEELGEKLNILAQEDSKKSIKVYADENISYGKVIDLLSNAQRLGIYDIELMTAPKDL